jgi:hypothetical protein
VAHTHDVIVLNSAGRCRQRKNGPNESHEFRLHFAGTHGSQIISAADAKAGNHVTNRMTCAVSAPRHCATEPTAEGCDNCGVISTDCIARRGKTLCRLLANSIRSGPLSGRHDACSHRLLAPEVIFRATCVVSANLRIVYGRK